MGNEKTGLTHLLSAALLEKKAVIFLMGPTASGKTGLAIELSKHLPVDLISVDSTLVYRDMTIGTAKPTAEELVQAPHRLIDICDPAESYSVADFCDDAQREINQSFANGRIPLLVGGTMMYFKSLLEGLADMPASNPTVRATIMKEAAVCGWPEMHRKLAMIDSEYAEQLHPNHSQRIARALEVHLISGKTMSWYRKQQLNKPLTALFTERFKVFQLALIPSDRAYLHVRIQERFFRMLEQGLISEVKRLRDRPDLHLNLPSMRSVGYRQVWHYLDATGNSSEENLGEDDAKAYTMMIDKSLAATRQLAKRQLTWLRGWSDLQCFSAERNMTESTLQKNVELILNFLSIKSL